MTMPRPATPRPATPRLSTPRHLLTAVTALVALVGCGSGSASSSIGTTPPTGRSATTAPAAGGSGSAAPSSGPASATPSEGVAGDAPPPSVAPAGTQQTGQQASSDASLTVTGFRTGPVDGYERVVVDLGGTGTPGWLVDYTDSPTADGSGEPVDVAGRAHLQVVVRGVGYPFDTGVAEYAGPEAITPDTDGPVQQIVYTSVFEGQAQVFLGLDSQRPFRVFGLTDPARLVIDVATG